MHLSVIKLASTFFAYFNIIWPLIHIWNKQAKKDGQ